MTIDFKKIRDEIRKSRPIRKNRTFHLSVEIVKTFEKVCDKNKLKTAETLEKIMVEFIKGYSDSLREEK